MNTKEPPPVIRKFVLHWGEMGARWGINRTVAQVHALLFMSSKPLNAEEIAEALSVARSNVSTSLRELQSWGIVKIVHVMGDRRDHFESLKDIWELFHVILNERKRREIDPTLQMLRECATEAAKTRSADRHARERIQDMLEVFETVNAWYQQMTGLPASTLAQVMKRGSALPKTLAAKG